MADDYIGEYGDDPFGGYNFFVSIDDEDGIKARFTEVSGLKGEIDGVHEIKEGGLNYRTHKFPGRVKWGPITLKKGVADDSALEDWWKSVVSDPKNCRKNVSIILLNRDMSEVKRWNVRNAWPSAWEGTALNAGGSDLAIETVVLEHEGITDFTSES